LEFLIFSVFRSSKLDLGDEPTMLIESPDELFFARIRAFVLGEKVWPSEQ
jgi:hypothetical protein